MKKTALLKTSLREIGQSKTRFISILGIIFLGIMVFVGLKATGPDMTRTATLYFNKEKLPDARVVSSLGLTEKDVTDIKNIDSVLNVYPRYTADLQLSEKNVAVKFISYDSNAKNLLGNFLLIDGSLPKKNSEIVLDVRAQTRNDYKIGDQIQLSAEDDPNQALKINSFKVVGFVQSPEYIENISRGNTTVGKGTLDYFALILKEDMNVSAYTEILVSFKGLSDLNSYSKEYLEKRSTEIEKVKKALADRPTERVDEIRDSAKDTLAVAQEEISSGEKTLADSQAQLQIARQQIDEGNQALSAAKKSYSEQINSAESKLKQKEIQLQASENQLVSQQANYEARKNELAQAEPQIQQAKQSLLTLKQQQADFQSANLSLGQLMNGYQGLFASLEHINSVSDDLLTASIVETTPNLNAVAQQLGTESISLAMNQLILVPTRQNLSATIETLNKALSDATIQQKELSSKLQTVTQAITEIEQKISVYDEGQQQIAVAQVQLETATSQLNGGKQQFNSAKQELVQSKTDAEAEFSVQEAKLIQAQNSYEQGLLTFTEQQNEALPNLTKAKEEVASKTKELNALTSADYYYFTRSDNPGYSEYEDNSNRIASLATIFPIFFFLIAALVSLTTMTRMVEEKRMEIGSLKALGYSNLEIAFKFLVYASIASLTGTFLGLVLGYYLFPTIIFNAYGQLYNIPNFITPWYLDYSIFAILIAVLCTVGASMVVLRIDLFSSPSKLLRPKAPKSGRRILLERIKPIWSRLSFNQKVTARNLFRYKQRMLMTVIGIAGCMALIITGFGLKDSISDIVSIQFNKIWHYQAIVALKNNTSKSDINSYEESLKQIEDLKAFMPLHVEQVETTKKGITKQDVSIYVPENVGNIDQFVLFNNRQTGKKYQLQDDGVIINEKLADLFNYKVGDTLVIKDDQNNEYRLMIQAIAENYTGHFAYMTANYYEQIFNKLPNYNRYFLLFDQELTQKQEDSISKTIMENQKVLNISFLSASSNALDSTIQSLNIVVWVLITVSGILAFIVLYNLTNINISERIRELSTIKVLGFYDKELTMYVYRENIILTIIGIIIGCFFGKITHMYVLKTVEVDILMFSPTIHWISYVYSAGLTFLFTLLVMLLMHKKLKKVDMIEALKSID